MGNPKDEVATLLNNLPDDASYEDIQYHLYVLEKVKRAMSRSVLNGEAVAAPVFHCCQTQ